MARVYAALKTQIMSGAFAPGDRLDPAKLSDDLAASVTPVRDALHRLTGERLIDSWQQEGFRIPLVTEATLRDFYTWHADALIVVIRGIERNPQSIGPNAQNDPEQQANVNEFGDLLARVAARSSNREHRAIIGNLNDRGTGLRAAEAWVVNDSETLVVIADALNRKAWTDARSSFAFHFRRRLARVADIASLMRAREPM